MTPGALASWQHGFGNVERINFSTHDHPADDAAWSAPSGENAVSKNGDRGPEGFALWTRAAIVLKGESWERAPGVLRGLSKPLDFFAAGLVGGLVGSSIRAAMTAASNGVLLSAESLSDAAGLLGAGLGAGAEDSPAPFPAGSAADILDVEFSLVLGPEAAGPRPVSLGVT